MCGHSDGVRIDGKGRRLVAAIAACGGWMVASGFAGDFFFHFFLMELMDDGFCGDGCE